MLRRIARLLKRSDERDPYMDVLREISQQRTHAAAPVRRRRSWLGKLRRDREARGD